MINAAAELPDTPLDDNNVIYCKIPVTDSSYENIHQYFDSTADLIHKVSILKLNAFRYVHAAWLDWLILRQETIY